MEEDIRKLCIGITEILLADENGWLFAEPVDPVRDGCPTYFSVIKHPMDLGTILTKLNSNQYSSFAEYDSDVRLVFSNCLQYNTGKVSRNFRRMATTLRSLYEKLRKANGLSVQANSTRVETWKQCDLCLKWRRLVIPDPKRCRWCCADSNGLYTCDTAEEQRPLGKAVLDCNSFQTVLDSAYINLQKLSSYYQPLLPPYDQEWTEAENFWRYLQTCWACDQHLKASLSSITTEWEQLSIAPFKLYQIVNDYHHRWHAVHEYLQTVEPRFNNSSIQQTVEQLYERTVSPYVQGWLRLKEVSITSSSSSSTSTPTTTVTTKRSLPTIDDIYRREQSDSKKANTGVELYCKQCSSPLHQTAPPPPPSSFTCKLCRDVYCNQCISTLSSHPRGISGEWICDHCCEQVRPSWGEYSYCIGCSLDISDKESASSACVKCKKCKALFHTRCASAPVKDRRNWVCKDCIRLGNLVGTVIIDPTSRVLQCYYSEEISVN